MLNKTEKKLTKLAYFIDSKLKISLHFLPDPGADRLLVQVHDAGGERPDTDGHSRRGWPRQAWRRGRVWTW